ncbi:hypothetical protein FCM35_KLT10268 [Carex littledalei]|uniref:Zinc knuckle CX2CX4HX4C domain-containing protein n=1 Tax=Carex littledalei TaxID=544730 RepID=A0A833V5M9_9POAL|nr:hypothetical protein FCM35_KLT10268 [Carex littledalei]
MLLSEPIPSSYNGKHFLRVKMLISLSGPVKDNIKYSNPNIGESKVHVVYEKIGRICCFCGSMGHEMASCLDRARLAKIKSRLANANRPKMEGIIKPTRCKNLSTL